MGRAQLPAAGLLETLAARAGCMYLSDLHQPECLPTIQQALQSITPSQFSLWEWQDAVAYITGEQLRLKARSRRRITWQSIKSHKYRRML